MLLVLAPTAHGPFARVYVIRMAAQGTSGARASPLGQHDACSETATGSLARIDEFEGPGCLGRGCSSRASKERLRGDDTVTRHRVKRLLLL
jgi:hypothetical protein